MNIYKNVCFFLGRLVLIKVDLELDLLLGGRTASNATAWSKGAVETKRERMWSLWSRSCSTSSLGGEQLGGRRGATGRPLSIEVRAAERYLFVQVTGGRGQALSFGWAWSPWLLAERSKYQWLAVVLKSGAQIFQASRTVRRGLIFYLNYCFSIWGHTIMRWKLIKLVILNDSISHWTTFTNTFKI